jgi:hypothetical protein
MKRFERSLLLFLMLTSSSINIGKCEEAKEECIRGEPEPLFNQQSPNVKQHTFTLKSSHEADEEVLFKSGDVLKIKNWGCEYFVNTFHYESKSIQGSNSDVSYWFRESANALKKVSESNPNVMFDFQKAAMTLESKIKEGSELSFDHLPFPVDGDGVEFLQTQVVVKNGGLLKEKKVGFVDFELMKGPL